MADDLRAVGSDCGLSVLDVTYERIDDIAGELRPIGRGQRSPFLASEIIMHDQFVAVFREDEINARALVIPGEQQMRVGDRYDVAAAPVRY